MIQKSNLRGDMGQFAEANGIKIWHETFGNKENPTILLIMGACAQGILWPKAFCEKLANEGHYVIRYDHRDAGLSTCFNWAENPYDLKDMANDAVGLLNALGVKRAHLFGVSLGAYLAELMAIDHPEKVDTITLMGAARDIRPMNRALAGLPRSEGIAFSSPTSAYLAWMKEFMKLTPQNEKEQLAHRLEGWNQLNGFKIPLNDEMNRKVHLEFLSRLTYPQGMANHMAVLASKSAEEWVQKIPSRIKVPTAILQGSEDPIVRPDHGEALHHDIPHSEYFLVEGMGHVPNDHFFDFYIDVLKKQVSKATAK